MSNTTIVSIEFDDSLINSILERCNHVDASFNAVVRRALDAYLSSPGSVLNPWMSKLTFMQQSVLLAMVRNADGIGKHHPQKELIKWFRRCILQSAFDRCHLTEPDMPGGGSFTGPVANVHDALNEFIWARDEMTLHYFAHAMHAFEILGYHYPDEQWRKFWFDAYHRMVNALHLEPESKYEMDKRLSDNMNMWKAREDVCGGCTRTERQDQLSQSGEHVPHDHGQSGMVKKFSETIHNETTDNMPAPVMSSLEDLMLQDHEDALRRMAHNSTSQANVATADEPIPSFAGVRDGQFVNMRSGNALGHEFDLRWGARVTEFPQYVPQPEHNERGWQPK